MNGNVHGSRPTAICRIDGRNHECCLSTETCIAESPPAESKRARNHHRTNQIRRSSTLLSRSKMQVNGNVHGTFESSHREDWTHAANRRICEREMQTSVLWARASRYISRHVPAISHFVLCGGPDACVGGFVADCARTCSASQQCRPRAIVTAGSGPSRCRCGVPARRLRPRPAATSAAVAG